MNDPMNARQSRFRLGVNYWPSRSAMSWWRRFDEAEVERDFARIHAVGFDSVRVFLLWEDFQPSPDRVCEHALRRLVAVADAAQRAGLALVPTLFTAKRSSEFSQRGTFSVSWRTSRTSSRPLKSVR